jgi:SAM-dependent methyltransferase
VRVLPSRWRLQAVLDKLVLGKMGNKALAERAARKYLEDSPRKSENLEAADVRRRRLLLMPLAVPLAAWHALALALNLAFLLAVYASSGGGRSRFAAYRAKWEKLAEHWARLPSCFVYKAVELALYHDHAAAHGRNAVEIGVYTGETSRAFFLGQRLDVGVEYNIERFLIYKHAGRIHDHLFSADVRALPFAANSFATAYCVHSVDDMELPAESALREMARVVRPGGHVFFSGLTLNFKRHNLAIRLALALGLNRLADALFRLLHVGSFNHHDRGQWREILERCGLALLEYRTYVPFGYATLFDLAYRPETVLTNLCGWRSWLSPLAGSRWFREVLYRASAAMVIASERWTGRVEGINFFAVARREGAVEADTERAFSPARDVICARCRGPLPAAVDPDANAVLACGNCGAAFRVVEGVPLLLDLDP